ncbi:MAG TPA: PAS domain S-box protein [Desulfobulbus sp.]|nr:PAS domain S-box protein [Desulfobulbus sp.]
MSASKHDTSRFQCIFNAIADAVVFTDRKRKIVRVNPALEQIFGYQEKELLGKTTNILYASQEEYERQGRIRFHLNAEEKFLPYEVEYRKKDGTVFPSETIGAALEDETGETIGFVGLIRDITKRKKAENSLHEMELMYRTVADFTYDWELWTNLHSTFRYVSPSCERITGYTADQFMENPHLFQDIIVSEDRKAWDDHKHKVHKEYGLCEVQFRIRRKDGSVAWIEHACQPVVGPQGEILGFRSSNRDITERKKVEEELRLALVEIQKYKEQLEAESACLREEINLVCNYKRIIGSSNALKYVLFKVEQIAETETPVIIFGETGTGKELIARAIHEHSLRRDRPMLTINCAALPADLIESELFGHERGAFTSAHTRQAGRFEIADKATLFLDEIGELPLSSQGKLLRVLQNGEFERLGSSSTFKADVRIIAATNRDLEEDVRRGKFRQDLWYRLNVFPITVPPLRERLDDIPQLLDHFVDKFSRKQGRVITSMDATVLKTLQQYSWPGNIRELENVVERAVITSAGSNLTLADVLLPPSAEKQLSFKSLAEMERKYILEVLEETNWKVSGKNSAAEILGLKRSTLRAKMDKLGICKP